MVKMTLHDVNSDLTDEEKKELDAAGRMPAVFDEDSPRMTSEMLAEFKRVNHKSRTKQTASIRLSDKAQKFSQQYGKGYTSFFSRLIDAALDDETMVKKCL